MKIERTLWLLCVGVLAFSASACVRYYDTAKIRGSLIKSRRSMGKALVKTSQLDAMLRARFGAKVEGPELQEMQRCVAVMKKQDVELRKLYDEFRGIARGRSKVREDRPGWKETGDLRERYKQLVERIKANLARYKSAGQRLKATLRRRR